MYLDRIKKPKSPNAPEGARYQAFREEVAAAYREHARFMADWNYVDKEQASRGKSEKWGGVPSKDGAAVPSLLALPESVDTPFPEDIFDTDGTKPSTVPSELPKTNTQLVDTPQLAYCLAILNTVATPDEAPSGATRDWLQVIQSDQDEQKRLKDLAKSLVRAFTHDELKGAEAINEVTFVAPVLEMTEFRFLLDLFVNSLKNSALLQVHSLEGIARLLCCAPYPIQADDLVNTLRHINTSLQITHNQSTEYIYKLTTTVSRILDAMADSQVEGLQREQLHQPLYDYLEGLKNSDDPYLVFQAAYASQALLCVPNDESDWQAIHRKAGRIFNSAFQLVSAVKALDVNLFIEVLCTLQTGLGEIYNVVVNVKNAYEEVKSLYGNGRELKDALKDVSFSSKRTWYTALRGADTLLWNGQLVEFKRLVCDAPCRRSLAFQWGVGLRLGNLAVDSQWDDKSRRGAVAFLGHMYRDDQYWGNHVPVKQLILDILMQLSKSSMSVTQAAAEALLKEFKNDGNSAKRAMCLSCQESGSSPHPLMAVMSPPSSSALLDRAQGKLDLEADLKRLKLACQQRHVDVVYIAPKAKSSLQASDADLFDLKEKADDFLANEKQKVLLLLGESGVGKSTFNMRLEHQLWGAYENPKDRIPLFINLSAVDRPDQDLITKHLRKLQFEEPQIRELKKRKFVLICDGYDESQQTHNLYTSNRLNQEEEWQAQMVISCRSGYVGMDYKDRFQPGDRNQPASPGQLQEAVIMPFSVDQIEEYIKSFVDLEKPLWSAENYSSVLKKIPSLRELVKNPFLLRLSLDVLPRLVDPGQDLANAKVTRLALYDQFVEQWLERGKKRLVSKDMGGQERRAFESLSQEGFARNGILFLKRLAADVYDKQGGSPVIEYLRMQDEGSWKDKYFGRNDDIQLLRDACPLTRIGNQYRFVHRSILEYGVARAVFEPQNGGIGVEKTETLTSTSERRGSVGSAYSFEIKHSSPNNASPIEQGPDPESPLVSRSFVGEPSVLQFLGERAQQEPVFKKQLLAYVNASKDDKKWRIAAANAITILVRAGEQFNGVDLQRIQIPGADLSFGVFDSAQLQGADLRKVKLSNVWLRKANLGGARMSSVEFGELPYLQEEGAVSRCVYSPDGNTLMTILKDGGASVYSTLTWEKKWSVDVHVKINQRVAFSPKSDLIASFIDPTDEQNETDAVHLWKTETGNCRTLRGHTARILDVAYSRKGDMIASCSDDHTIRLWDATTGICGRILDVGPHVQVSSVDISPEGDRLVSAHGTPHARLWDLETDADFETLSNGSGAPIDRAIYSPTGTEIALVCNYGASGGIVWLRDLRFRTLTRMGTVKDRFKSGLFSHKGANIAAHYVANSFRIWNTETATFIYILGSNSDEYREVAFSPSDDMIVTGGTDQIVRIWDVETGMCRSSMSGHSDTIQSVAFSPHGRHIASGGDDMQVRLWKVGTGAVSTSSGDLGHTKLIVGHCHSSWDETIISVSRGDTVRLWNLQTGEHLQSLTELGYKHRSIALSPNGKQIASGTTGNSIHLWNLENGDSLMSLSDGFDSVSCVAYSPHGDQLASGRGWAVSIWDTNTGDCLQYTSVRDEHHGVHNLVYSPKAEQFASIVEHGDKIRLWDVNVSICRILQGDAGTITSIMYSPSGKEIASANWDRTIRLWNTDSGECRLILEGHEGGINMALYSPDGDEIASCSKDGTVRLWSVETGKCRMVLAITGVSMITYSPAGDVIASIDDHGTVQLWNVETGKSQSVLQDNSNGSSDSSRALHFSPRGDLMAIYEPCTSKGNIANRLPNRLRRVKLYDVATGELRRTFDDLSNGAAPVFSPNGSHIACPESTGVVRVWDVEIGACLHTLSHEVKINDVQYSAKGDLIATASDDKTVKLWDAKTGVCLLNIQDHPSEVARLAFSPKGDRIVSGYQDGFVCLWDTQSGTRSHSFSGHEGNVNSVAFSPNKRLLASGSDDTTVCLWNLEDASDWRVLKGHTASVLCLVFTSEGNTIASGSKDKFIKLWNVEAGTCSQTMAGASDEILCLAYSPNGELLASGTTKMTVHLWNVASGQSWAVIEGTYGNVTSVAWGAADNTQYLVAGCSDASVRVWRVVQEEDAQCNVILHWSSSHGALFVANCNLQGVKGLSEANKRLLEQGGATGKPEARKSLKTVGTGVIATSRFQQQGKTAMISEE
ncbi:hypothetical protein BGZ72_011007 [Mortierella alpina]|nr:hypothetical protein BGZ72_011007 [Mortierella alpina]